jgi:molybdopterin molybdotransferase
MPLISFEEARELIQKTAVSLQPETILLEKSVGYILAENVNSGIDYPTSDISAMDGYAVNSNDLNVTNSFPIAFEIPAGSVPRELEISKAARIFTGAVIPDGADTVVKQEDAKVTQDGRVILNPVPRGLNVRHCGEIFKKGQLLAQKGDAVTPALIANLATGSVTDVKIFPKPTMSILVTGSELVQLGQMPERGQTVDSNGVMLSALAAQDGLPVSKLIRTGDSLEQLKISLKAACESADVIVTSGGVSVGDYDLVAQAIAELGGTLVFHGVLQKPGKPLLTARIGSSWIIGLPGNPVAALVGWRLFVDPLTKMLMGCENAFVRDSVHAELTTTVRNNGKRPVFLQGNLFLDEGLLKVTDVSWKGSHDVVASGISNTLLYVGVGSENNPGDSVLCYPYRWKELAGLMQNEQNLAL